MNNKFLKFKTLDKEIELEQLNKELLNIDNELFELLRHGCNDENLVNKKRKILKQIDKLKNKNQN